MTDSTPIYLPPSAALSLVWALSLSLAPLIAFRSRFAPDFNSAAPSSQKNDTRLDHGARQSTLSSLDPTSADVRAIEDDCTSQWAIARASPSTWMAKVCLAPSLPTLSTHSSACCSTRPDAPVLSCPVPSLNARRQPPFAAALASPPRRAALHCTALRAAAASPHHQPDHRQANRHLSTPQSTSTISACYESSAEAPSVRSASSSEKTRTCPLL